MTDVHSRRTFLRAAAAAGAAWATADLALVEDALASAARQTASGGAFVVLTSEQAAVVDAVASRILPSVDGRPGAHEAGAVYFIDRALSTFNQKQARLYADGVRDLNRRAQRERPPASGFAALPADRQDGLLKTIEKSPFFSAIRFDTIVGTFGSAVWGGNRDMAGWQLIGFEHRPAFQPPFGYYDTDANQPK